MSALNVKIGGMRTFLLTILKTILVIIVVLTGIWYLFGQGGPLYDKGQEIAGLIFSQEDDSQADESGLQPESAQNTESSEEATDSETTEEEEAEPVDQTATILFTGDVEISEYVQAKYSSSGIDGIISPTLQQEMRDATVTMINNEFCFSTRGEKAADKQYTFRVDPSYVSLLTDLGVDIAGLANNHVLDYGRDALTDTFTTLTDAGIEYTGAGDSLEDASKLIVKTDAKGRTYGFLAASHVIPVASWNVENAQPGVFCFYDNTALIAAVKEAASQVDYLFVMVHWGTEHTTELTSYQVSDGHAIIDAGATAVIGMHSHCLQPMEYYQGKPIFYSLGNYIFNANITSGGAVAFDFDENDNMTVRFIAVNASDTYTKESGESLPEMSQ